MKNTEKKPEQASGSQTHNEVLVHLLSSGHYITAEIHEPISCTESLLLEKKKKPHQELICIIN